MRIDKFLNTTNILKSRHIAQDMLENQLIKVNSIIIKPSKNIKIDDIIEVQFLEYCKKYKILALPTTKTIPKNKKDLYIEELS